MTLHELIENLKSELRASQGSTSDPMFVIHDASIKTRVVVADKTKAGGGIKILVATGSIEEASENTSEFEITINLKPIIDNIPLGSGEN